MLAAAATAAPLPPRAWRTVVAQVREVLESETHVDMDKLLSLCQHGLPAALRGEAWMYLLGVSPPEKSEEMSLGKRMGQEFAELERALLPQSSELTRSVKGEVKRRRARAPQEASRDAKTRQRLERLLRCYKHGHGDEFRPGMVHLLGPLVHVYATDVEAYFCFQELMRRLERAPTFEGCKQMAVTFMTLLRHTLPDLYFYFEEEQCCGGPWLFSWLQFLLARELPLPCVLRLWDRWTRPPHRTSPTQWRRRTNAPALASAARNAPRRPASSVQQPACCALLCFARRGSYFSLSQSRGMSLQASLARVGRPPACVLCLAPGPLSMICLARAAGAAYLRLLGHPRDVQRGAHGARRCRGPLVLAAPPAHGYGAGAHAGVQHQG